MQPRHWQVKRYGQYVDMPKFLIDEDMPRSTAGVLTERGYEVKDVRDYGVFVVLMMKRFTNLPRTIRQYLLQVIWALAIYCIFH